MELEVINSVATLATSTKTIADVFNKMGGKLDILLEYAIKKVDQEMTRDDERSKIHEASEKLQQIETTRRMDADLLTSDTAIGFKVLKKFTIGSISFEKDEDVAIKGANFESYIASFVIERGGKDVDVSIDSIKNAIRNGFATTKLNQSAE